MVFWLDFSARLRGAFWAAIFSFSVIVPMACMRVRTWSRWAMAASRSLKGEKMWGPRMMPTMSADWASVSSEGGTPK